MRLELDCCCGASLWMRGLRSARLHATAADWATRHDACAGLWATKREAADAAGVMRTITPAQLADWEAAGWVDPDAEATPTERHEVDQPTQAMAAAELPTEAMAVPVAPPPDVVRRGDALWRDRGSGWQKDVAPPSSSSLPGGLPPKPESERLTGGGPDDPL